MARQSTAMSIYPRATEMTLPQWRELFARPDPRVERAFGRIYGDDTSLHHERLRLFQRLLEGAERKLPSHLPTALVRVPGRINTMGLHSDGQYSFKNHVVFGREMVAAVQRRTDDIVSLASPHQEYPDFSFSISRELPPGTRGVEWIRDR